MFGIRVDISYAVGVRAGIHMFGGIQKLASEIDAQNFPSIPRHAHAIVILLTFAKILCESIEDLNTSLEIDSANAEALYLHGEDYMYTDQ
ncbi:24471_t:CDS:2 [Dentiscutata erythropus]|uniref:24471_t:CDS:1 n=1 Tax=Dentiscutata erythropus TaxID=1348616 RepID=A0A9N9HDI1_9GLOM|nr:24471_t:CDS:2 [Dentiscutata erythropus]